MPLYDYQCPACQKIVEVRHGFDDVYTEPCSACGSELKRIINPAPIIFKGSGFYVTDSRKKEASSSESSSASSTPAQPASPSTPTPPTTPPSSPSPSPSKESAA